MALRIRKKTMTKKADKMGGGVTAFQEGCRRRQSKFDGSPEQGSLRNDVTRHATVAPWLERHDAALAANAPRLAAEFMVRALRAARALA